MAILIKNDQQLYVGKGPVDAKALVKTYAELFSAKTWTKSNVLVAYNGMIVAVWLNKADTSKNGIYFLFDPTVTSAVGKPDYTNEANWHRIASVSDLAALTTRLNSIEKSLTELEERLTTLEDDSDVNVYDLRSEFPEAGELNKLYIAADEGKTYVWINNDYLPVGGTAGSYEEPTVIHGGSATSTN
jgi:hypothetical protein